MRSCVVPSLGPSERHRHTWAAAAITEEGSFSRRPEGSPTSRALPSPGRGRFEVPDHPRRILLTGATGYIGGELLLALRRAGHRVRCMVRDPRRFTPPAPTAVDVVAGDALHPETLGPTLDGVDAAYYLIHSMSEGPSFAEKDRRAAESFARAALEAGVKRIIYLGGLADTSRELSQHLRSRLEVGEILRNSGVPTIEFRASVVVGTGSLSFEILRGLTERLPVMTTPRWVRTLCQPIFIDDLLQYLVAALELPLEQSTIVEIGGADEVSYQDLMVEYGRQRGLRRLILPVPVLTPYLSSLWLALVTPVHFRVGRRLIESLGETPTVVRDGSAAERLAVRPRGAAAAITQALADENRRFDELSWAEFFGDGGERQPYGGHRIGPRRVETHAVRIGCPCSGTFGPIEQIGGEVGWYYGSWLWTLRGAIDRLLGGPGLRKGRPATQTLEAGDQIDFWSVEHFEPRRRLRLFARMKLPGRAWLDFEAQPLPEGCLLRQTAVFDPVGLIGLLYWYAVYPIHGWLFRGMLRSIADRVRR
jgi:uncharacterized protein YbjT (DUF2867 family)